MQLSQEMFVQQLREYVGPTFDGPVISSRISISQNGHSTDITLTVSCARNLAMAPTTEANLQPSPFRPTSPSQSLSDSSLNTSTLSLVIYDGTDGPTMNSRRLGSLLPLLEERGGSLEGVTIRLLNEKVSLTIPKEVLPTS